MTHYDMQCHSAVLWSKTLVQMAAFITRADEGVVGCCGCLQALELQNVASAKEGVETQPRTHQVHRP